MKNRWAIGIVIVMGLFMSFIIMLVVKTYQLKVDLVAEDYYSQELNYQNQLNKINNVEEHDKVDWKILGDEIVFSFPDTAVQGVQGTIEFFRPSDATLDKTISIRLDKNGKQYLPKNIFVSGLYNVKVDWSANQKEYFMEDDFYLP